MKYSSIVQRIFASLSLFIVLGNACHSATAQATGADRGMAFTMLDMTKDAIKKNYFDPTYRGIDVDFVFEQARERIKVAPTRDAMMITIASAVMAFDDSHTTFAPPARAADIEYGWIVSMVGDEAFVTRVKPGSDAEAKGLKPGDKLIAIDGFKPTRKNLWQMYYRYQSVAPTAKVAMTILSPGETSPRVLDIQTKIQKTSNLKSLQEYYDRGTIKRGWFDSNKIDEFVSFEKDLLIWKMNTFSRSPGGLDAAMSKARDYKNLIIDLRGNRGGFVEVELRMTGYFFEKDVKVGDEKTRKETKERIAKTRGGGVYKGNVIVLVDSESASAAEVFAKILQLEKRAKIIGDRTSGAVMTSRFHSMDSGIGNILPFGVSVTVGDLIMPDGKSLEKIGVTPDEVVLPTGADMATSKDPVLAHAAKLAGVEITPHRRKLVRSSRSSGLSNAENSVGFDLCALSLHAFP
jgi:C-terminal processing protease CtpA/Prc